MGDVRDRPRTLAEGKEWLLDRLAKRHSPMYYADEAQARATIQRLEGLDGEAWAAAWGGTGATFEQQALEAEHRGDKAQAAKAWFQAFTFCSIGRYPCPNHPRKRACCIKARECFLKATAPSLTRVAVPFEGKSDEGAEVVFYVRKPAGATRPPVMVIWGGVDTWKEETYDLGSTLLAEGLAVVSIDMPGVGESPVVGSPDGERQYTPALDWIRAQPDLDGSRIGCMGLSFGGYWAAKLAHTHRQYLKAVVDWGGGTHYTFQPEWFQGRRYPDSYLMDLFETRAHSLGGSTYEDYAARIGALSLLDQGLLDQPSAPLLLVNGKDDQQTTIEDLYLLLEHGSPKDARIFPGGHMGNTPETRPTIIRWLCRKLVP